MSMVFGKGRRGNNKLIPPGMPGYEASFGKQYELNSAKAKQLLAEAGFPEGKDAQGYFPGHLERHQPACQSVHRSPAQEELGRGCSDRIRRLPHVWLAFYYEPVSGHDPALEWRMALPDNWLPELFGSGAGNNHVGYSNAKFDELIKKARAEVTTRNAWPSTAKPRS
jgi:oligopeptide transport system substrate-binding protein